METALARVRAAFGARYPLLIGSRRVAGRDRSEIRYPADEETVIGYIATSNSEDVTEAVRVAKQAFPC